MNTQELHVIFGTGALASAVMRELLRRGKRVRMVNRSGKANVPNGVEVIKGDATDIISAKAVTQGASVVYQCAQADYTKWPELFPPIQAGILEGAAANGARLVIGDNLYMYGPYAGLLTEDLPYAATTRKGRVRAQMAQDALDAHQSGKLRVTIGRASDFYGPGATTQGIFGSRVIEPMLMGKQVSMFGNIDLPHTFSYIKDFGKGLVILGEHDAALGQAWHIPNAPTITTREALHMLFDEAGLPPKIGTVPNVMVKLLGFVNPVVREVDEMMYEFNEPFVVDHSKFERAFGNIATPHREAMRATLAWFKQQAVNSVPVAA